jgi:hypothetical protein
MLVLPRTLVWIAAVPLVWAGLAAADEPDEQGEKVEKVALRASDGRFLRAGDDGRVVPRLFWPGERETFELVEGAEGRIALKTPDGRFLVAAGRDGRTLRAAAGDPGGRGSFLAVPGEGNRVGLKTAGPGPLVTVAPGEEKPSEDGWRPSPEVPGEHQALEIYHVGEMPAPIRLTLALAIQTLAAKELVDEEYDKTRSKLKRRYVELPAPTLRDPGRKKRHKVFAMREETRLVAKLDGTPKIRVVEMPYLKDRRDPEVGLLMFVVEAEIPVQGHARYKVPEAWSASTGFRATAAIHAVAELRARRTGDRVSLDPPKVLDVRAEVCKLDLSNDLLNTARAAIEDLINHELRDRHDKIVAEANEEIAEAVQSQEFRVPLLDLLK